MDNAFPIVIGVIIGVVATILIKRARCCSSKKEGDKKEGDKKEGEGCCGDGHKH